MNNIDLKNLELLAPAGSPEKMKYAFHYGADAVYAGIPDFSLRARMNAFTFDSLKKSVEYAHKSGKKFYVTLNIYAHNQHFKKLEKHIEKLSKLNIDGIILSDPGILKLVKKYLPNVETHLSTQANATNWQAVKFWSGQGIKRVVLAREVTLKEIKEIHQKVPEVELEYFVHGAMCMSYSGRCILSKWMSGRSANLGDCSQPCRWAYKKVKSGNKKSKNDEIKKMIVEDHQEEFKIDLEEDSSGTYFFNSKDLNLLAHLKVLAEAGVSSFKIEGRNKSVYYLVTVIRAYSRIMNYEYGEEKKSFRDALVEENKNLNELVHRGYTEGFLLGCEPEHNFENSHNKSKYEFVGEILEVKNKKRKMKRNNLIQARVHNAIYADDKIEVINKSGNYSVKILNIYNEKMEKVKSAHGGHKELYYLEINKKNIESMSLLRKEVD